jgi:hypothetical protein
VSPVASGALADEFVGWNPDMAGGPSARAAAPSPEPSPEPASGTRPPTLSRADVTASSGPRLEVPAGTPPTLGEAFAALLAAEQGQSFAPGARAATAPVPPEAIEDAVRRVLDGMTAQTVVTRSSMWPSGSSERNRADQIRDAPFELSPAGGPVGVESNVYV